MGGGFSDVRPPRRHRIRDSGRAPRSTAVGGLALRGARRDTGEGALPTVPALREGEGERSVDLGDVRRSAAYVRARRLDGVGYEFSSDDPFVGIDLDDCYDGATIQS